MQRFGSSFCFLPQVTEIETLYEGVIQRTVS